MGRSAKPNICIVLFAPIFFVQRQQKSISTAITAMRAKVFFFNFYCEEDTNGVFLGDTKRADNKHFKIIFVNMKMKNILFFAIVITYISACQKDFSQEILANQSRIISDSSLLKTYVELDTIGGLDTLYKITYQYDNNQRLIVRKEKNYTDSFFANRYYSYNANDTLANKILEIYYSTSLIDIFYDSSFTFFTRNSNNKLLKDSSIIFSINQGVMRSQKVVSDFTYFTSDSIGRKITIYNAPFNNVERWSYRQIKNGTNIIKETEYIIDDSTNTSYMNRVANFSYDSRYNPFYAEKINYPVTFNPNNFIYSYTPVNNIISEDFSGLVQNTLFSYNTLGLPIVSILTYIGSPSNAIKGIYIYGN